MLPKEQELCHQKWGARVVLPKEQELYSLKNKTMVPRAKIMGNKSHAPQGWGERVMLPTEQELCSPNNKTIVPMAKAKIMVPNMILILS